MQHQAGLDIAAGTEGSSVQLPADILLFTHRSLWTVVVLPSSELIPAQRSPWDGFVPLQPSGAGLFGCVLSALPPLLGTVLGLSPGPGAAPGQTPAAKKKTQQHGAQRFLPAWHTSVITCVDTEQCCHVTVYVAVAVNTSPRLREPLRAACSENVSNNVPNKRARAHLGDVAHHRGWPCQWLESS